MKDAFDAGLVNEETWINFRDQFTKSLGYVPSPPSASVQPAAKAAPQLGHGGGYMAGNGVTGGRGAACASWTSSENVTGSPSSRMLGAAAMSEVLGSHDLLVRVLSFSPTPSDLGRSAVVNKAFRAASEVAGDAVLARTLPMAAALRASGASGLDRDGLVLRIVRAFAIPPPVDVIQPKPPEFYLSDYTMMIQVHDRDRDVVCFSSSAVLTQDAVRRVNFGGIYDDADDARGQGFDNEVELPNQVEPLSDAQSDVFWKDYNATRTNVGDVSFADAGRLQLSVVLTRRSDGAVHQLVYRQHLDLAYMDGGRESGFFPGRFACFYLPRLEVDPGEVGDEDNIALHFIFEMEAEDAAGAPWEFLKLNFGDLNETDEFSTANNLAQGLAMLHPWT
jgi:hypothetical protein